MTTTMGDHVSMMDAQFSTLPSRGYAVAVYMKIAVLISSLANWLEYGPMIWSVNTLQKDLIVRNHTTMLVIEDSNSLAMKRTITNSKSIAAFLPTDDGDGSLDVAKKERQWIGKGRQVQCFKCEKSDT